MSYAGEGVALDDQRVWDGTKWVLAKRPLTQAQTLSATGSWDGLADYILVTGTGARVITLPKPTLVPRNVTVIDAAGNSSTNLITVVAAGGGTIGGQSSVLLNVDHAVIDLAFVSAAGAGSWSNVSRNLAARRVYGRADGAGTGAGQELTGAQLGSIIRSNTVTVDTTTGGTVATYALTSAQNAVKFAVGVGNTTIHGATAPAESGQVVFWHVDSAVTTNRVSFTEESASAGAALQRFRTPNGQTLTLGAGDSAVSCYFDGRHHIVACSPQAGYQHVFRRELFSTLSGAVASLNPAGFALADRVHVTLSADATLHGIVAPYVGFSFELSIRSGNFVLTVDHNSGGAGTANERILCPRDADVQARLGEALRFTYSGALRWIVNAVSIAHNTTGEGVENSRGLLRAAAKTITTNATGGTQNDLALGTTDVLRVTTKTTLTGFAGGYAGRHLYVMSVGVTTTIPNESALSTAANRTTGSSRGDVVLNADDSAHLLYTGTRWHVIHRDDLDSPRYTELIDHFNTYFEVGANVLLGDTPWLITSNDGQHDTAPSGAGGTTSWGRFELRTDNAASINDYAVLCKGHALGFASMPYGWRAIQRVRFLGSITNATNGRLVFGIGDYLGDINFSAVNRSIIITGSSGSANWRFIHFNAGGGTADQDTGVPFNTLVRLFEIVRVGDISTGAWQCWIDGVLCSTIAVDVPNLSVNFGVLVQSLAASQRVAIIDMLSIRSGTLTGPLAA